MKGYHYHNPQAGDFGEAFVARTLLKNLLQDEVPLPLEERWQGGPTTFPLKKLGIGHPVLITTKSIDWRYKLEVDDVEDEAEKPAGDKDKKSSAASAKPANRGSMMPTNSSMPNESNQAKKKMIDAPRYEFVVQFCWQVPPPDTMVELMQIYPGAADPANAAGEAAVVVDGEAGEANTDTTDETATEPAGEAEPAMEGNEAEPESGDDDPADANSNEEK